MRPELTIPRGNRAGVCMSKVENVGSLYKTYLETCVETSRDRVFTVEIPNRGNYDQGEDASNGMDTL